MRATLQEVAALPDVLAVIDATDDGRLAGAVGVGDDDVLEVVHHFTGTWDHLTHALLPVLAEATNDPWVPAAWWACAGGERVAIGRDGRMVVAMPPAARLLDAASGSGVVAGVAVW
jgi:roadblock/LC7 domain-containing protein